MKTSTRPEVAYGADVRTLTEEEIGTRYVLVAVRILVDPNDPKDVEAVRALQDAIKVEPAGRTRERSKIPNWDPSSQIKVRDALLELARRYPTPRACSGQGKVDPVRHLIGAAAAWGGNPRQDAIYLNVTPPNNDGKTIYRLTVKDVPVDGFWSISVYDAKGYYEPNPDNAYSLNNITAKTGEDGSYRDPVRRLRRQNRQLPADSGRMELSGAPLSPAARDRERRVDISRAAGGAMIGRILARPAAVSSRRSTWMTRRGAACRSPRSVRILRRLGAAFLRC